MKIDNELINKIEPVETSALEGIMSADYMGISQDSRKIQKGDIFVCVEGGRVDGHKFIDDVIKKGAQLVICSRKPAENVPYILVKDTLSAMSVLSAAIYNHPSREMGLIGVTGTNGKTTVTHLVEAIFEKAGMSCALIGTLGSRLSSSEEYSDMGHTTPQAPELQQNLRTIADKGIKRVVMEVSSHSLELRRVSECEFAGAVYTNLTQDHLDYHITMDNYFKAKVKLLSLLKKQPEQKRYAVINFDDEHFAQLPSLMPADVENIAVYTYGVKNEADITAKDIAFTVEGAKFLCKTPVGERKVKMNLTGMFNIYNVLAAIGVGIAEGIDLKTCVEAVEAVPSIPGRFEVVSHEPLVIVDYAHTPDGLENVLKAAKELVPANGSLICVFGCGGDRDVTKRPQMGRIAEELCDKVIITSDNPRTEDPQQIITDILTGITSLDSKKTIVEIDRSIAIEQAIVNSSPKDVIVIAGKGHEDYQIIADEKIHFDDREEARNALKKIRR